MAADRSAPVSYALIDLAAVVVSPGLVMGMVGSLVYFLIDVLYRGDYPGRLLWCMGFFVFGAVLIARLAIDQGRKYAAIYSAGLGGACFLAMMVYVKFDTPVMQALGPVINIALMAVVWWSADRLTWDCTHLDEDRKASGRGLLAAGGLDPAAEDPAEEADDEPEDPKAAKKRKKEADGFLSWVDRYQAFRKQQNKKPHTPGVWVLYFALAALPLFALGQSLIPADDAERRRAVFFDMALYIGCALGLLVTTTLFGLRKYLEERNAKVPPVLAISWLGLGGGLIVVFLVVGALLPRPHSETPLVKLGGTKKGDRKASQYAVNRDRDGGKGQGAAGQKTEKGAGKASGKGGEQGGSSGEKGGGGGKGDSQGGKQSGGSKGNSQGNQSRAGQGKDESAGKKDSRGDSKQQDNQKQANTSAAKGDQKDDQNRDRSDADKNDKDADQGDNDADGESNDSGPSQIAQALEAVSGLIKWVVWIAVAVAVIAAVVYFALKGLSPFTKWAQGLLDWLRGLFGGRERGPTGAGGGAEAPAGPPRRTFADYTNPFADGSAGGRDPAELAGYTFAAFDAWAGDRACGRGAGETPLEFAVRVGHEYPDLDEPGFHAAEVLVRVLYSKKPAPADARKRLEDLWDQLDAAPRAAVRS